jgi:Hydrolase of X-linked nucleoside diphosphate N terminal
MLMQVFQDWPRVQPIFITNVQSALHGPYTIRHSAAGNICRGYNAIEMSNEDLFRSRTSHALLAWSKRLQAIAQTGLTDAKDQYDIERYQTIRQIASEMMSACSGSTASTRFVELFERERGHATAVQTFRGADLRNAVFRGEFGRGKFLFG